MISKHILKQSLYYIYIHTLKYRIFSKITLISDTETLQRIIKISSKIEQINKCHAIYTYDKTNKGYF